MAIPVSTAYALLKSPNATSTASFALDRPRRRTSSSSIDVVVDRRRHRRRRRHRHRAPPPATNATNATNAMTKDNMKALWMPFTPNKLFKSSDRPRVLARAKGTRPPPLAPRQLPPPIGNSRGAVFGTFAPQNSPTHPPLLCIPLPGFLRSSKTRAGMHYWTTDGCRILDGTSGLWCSNAGHCTDSIVKATQDQLSTLDFAPSFLFGHDKVVRVRVPPREQNSYRDPWVSRTYSSPCAARHRWITH